MGFLGGNQRDVVVAVYVYIAAIVRCCLRGCSLYTASRRWVILVNLRIPGGTNVASPVLSRVVSYS